MKRLIVSLLALSAAVLFAQVPVKQTLQARQVDEFFGPVIPNQTLLRIKSQIIEEVKTYVSTNSTNLTIEDVVTSEAFSNSVSRVVNETITYDMIREIVGTNTITEAEAKTIIADSATIKVENAQIKSGFEEITNVVIKSDMSVEELKSALIAIIGGAQKALGGTTNVTIVTVQPNN